jgi:hypothetical protein
MSNRGMTLVELLIGTALLVGGGGALVMGMHYGRIHSSYLTEYQVSMNAIQGKLEELTSTDLTVLWTDPMYEDARSPEGQCMGLGEDDNCNNILDVGEDENGNGLLEEPLPGARLHVRIQETPAGATNPSLLTLHVAACWRARGRQVSEDVDCDGRLDSGEDVNGTGWYESPAMATTRVGMDG